MKCVRCGQLWDDCFHWDHESVRLNEAHNARFWRLAGLALGILVGLLAILQ